MGKHCCNIAQHSCPNTPIYGTNLCMAHHPPIDRALKLAIEEFPCTCSEPGHGAGCDGYAQEGCAKRIRQREQEVQQQVANSLIEYLQKKKDEEIE